MSAGTATAPNTARGRVMVGHDAKNNPPQPSEKIFQAQVIQIARMNGWKVFHPATMRGHDGSYRTPLTGDKGFPDLVLAHPTRGCILAELKTDKGRLSAEQKSWATALQKWVNYYVWRPADLDYIARRLGGHQ